MWEYLLRLFRIKKVLTIEEQKEQLTTIKRNLNHPVLSRHENTLLLYNFIKSHPTRLTTDISVLRTETISSMFKTSGEACVAVYETLNEVINPQVYPNTEINKVKLINWKSNDRSLELLDELYLDYLQIDYVINKAMDGSPTIEEANTYNNTSDNLIQFIRGKRGKLLKEEIIDYYTLILSLHKED